MNYLPAIRAAAMLLTLAMISYPILPSSQIAQANEVYTIEASISSKSNARPVEGLSRQDFRVSINKQSADILEVIEERKPLALVAIFVLGVNGKCSISSYSTLTKWIGTSLRNVLQPHDQVGVIVTNAQGELLLRFDAPTNEWENLFGSDWKPGIPRLVSVSEAQSVACRAFVRNGDSKDGLEFGGTTFPETINVSPGNYLSVAFKNALNYLHTSKRGDTRPAIMVINDMYNMVDFTLEDEKIIMDGLREDKVTVHWLGKPEGSGLGCCHIITEPACIDPPHKRANFFLELPKTSGGQVISCGVFRTENRWGRALDPQIEVSRSVVSMINRLRHSYTIKARLQKTVDIKEKLKLEVIGKKAKDIVITHSTW